MNGGMWEAKKLFSPVVVVAVLFLAIVYLSANFLTPGKAAAITDFDYTPPTAVVGTFVTGTNTKIATFTAITEITEASTIILTLPLNTTLAGIVNTDFAIVQATTTTGVAGATTSPTAIAFNDSNDSITFTVASSTRANGGTGNGKGLVTIVLTSTAAGTEIRHPTTATTTATSSVVTSVGDSATQTGLSFTHDVANQFVITNPTDGTVDAAVTVTVQLLDHFLNRITSGADMSKDVAIVASGSTTGEGTVDIVAGVGTKALSDRVAETVDLTLDDVDDNAFATTSVQNLIFAHGVSTDIAVVTQPSETLPSTSMSPSVVLRITDQYLNTNTDEVSNVTVVIGTNPAGGALTGTLTRAAVAGVATFNDLKVDTAGTGYTFVGSATGVTSTTTSAFNISATASGATYSRSSAPLASPELLVVPSEFVEATTTATTTATTAATPEPPAVVVGGTSPETPASKVMEVVGSKILVAGWTADDTLEASRELIAFLQSTDGLNTLIDSQIDFGNYDSAYDLSYGDSG